MTYRLAIGLFCVLSFAHANGIDAYATTKSHADITFTSEPSGAEVHVQKYSKKGKKKKGETCVTPCSMELRTEKWLTFRINYDGYAGGKASINITQSNKGILRRQHKSPEMEVSLDEDGTFHAKLRNDEELLAYKEDMEARNLAWKKERAERWAEKDALNAKANAALHDPRPADCKNTPDSSPDEKAVPLVRVPPVFPSEALNGDGRSGHCKVRFNVNPAGRTVDLEAKSCSHDMFKQSSLNAVKRFYYNPKLENKIPVSYCGVETKISFIMKDERGNTLPE